LTKQVDNLNLNVPVVVDVANPLLPKLGVSWSVMPQAASKAFLVQGITKK